MSEFTQFLKTARALTENRVSLFNRLGFTHIPKLLEDLKEAYVLAKEQAYENITFILPKGTSESCSKWLVFLNELDDFIERYPVSCSVEYVSTADSVVTVATQTNDSIVIIIGDGSDFNLSTGRDGVAWSAFRKLFMIDKKILWLMPKDFEEQEFMFTLQLNFWAAYVDIYDGIYCVFKDKFGRGNRGLSLTDIPFATLKEQHHGKNAVAG